MLLLANGDDITVGAPFVAGATVALKVLAHGREDKIRIQKAHRRKRYRRVKGHKQGYTEIEITGISL